jgi:hypothetical protein
MQAEAARKNRVIVCEELNHIWDQSEIDEFLRLWEEGYTVHQIAAYFKRQTKEVALLLINTFSEYRLRQLIGFRWGEKSNRSKRIALEDVRSVKGFECMD